MDMNETARLIAAERLLNDLMTRRFLLEQAIAMLAQAIAKLESGI